MTDELRDRIAEVIFKHPAECSPEQAAEAADAVIVELGLREESRAYAPAYDGGRVHYNPEAVRNGDAMGAYIGGLPIERRYLTDWEDA